MKTKEEIIALLVALGKTSDEVSNSLIEKGIKGYKHLCRSCPIATYLLDNGVDLARGVGSMMGKRGWFWIDPTNDIVFIGMIQRMGGNGGMNLQYLSRSVIYGALVDPAK